MIQENVNITHLSNFKTFCKAKYFYIFTWNIKELQEVLDFANKHNLQKIFVWWGTNILFAFEYFDGIIIKIDVRWFSYEDKKLKVWAWEYIWDIANKLETEYNNDLWHRFIGLPWTVGGAVYGNAWCFGLEIENNFEKAEVFNITTQKLEILYKKHMDFSYRSSKLKKEKNFILLNAWFDLSKKEEKYHSDVDNIYFRKYKQPSWNTCGSFFKNPSKENSAWKLIEWVWLKWFSLKTAYFSSLHANFLMSKDNGNYKDLLELIDLAKKKVKNKYWIELEEEVNVIR